MKGLSGFFVFLLYAFQTHFAQLPTTDLHLIKLVKEKDSLRPGKVIKISAQSGYNSQPGFSLDETSVYFSSAGTSGQTEIWCYELRSKKIRQVTSTALSEYSPQEIKPDLLYAVTVEADSSQKIHSIDAATGTHLGVLSLDSVGYYCFLNQDSLVYYKLTDPHSLRVYSISRNEEVWLGNQPARGFKPMNRHALLYALKDSSSLELMIYDFALQKAKTLAHCPIGSEDYFWHSELGILRSEKSKILRWQEKSSTWVLLLDLEPLGFKALNRFTFDKKLKYLVLVNKSGD